MDSGFLLVDKPKDWTSFDVCAKLRGILGVKRIGHTGTLDPFATGLLIIAVGKTTKLIPFLEKDQKTYVTKIRFGVTSDTLDPTGQVLEKEEIRVKKEEIEKALKAKFMGKIQQMPPKYSALKVGGKKMYELAREGKEVEIKPREAEVFRAEILHYEYPYVDIELEVAAGFYVRSFARDLANQLGTEGICWELRRVAVGALGGESSYKVYGEESLKDGKREDFGLIDPKEILTISQIEIEGGRLEDFRGGRAFSTSSMQYAEFNENQKYLVLCDDESVGVGEVLHGKLQPRIVF